MKHAESKLAEDFRRELLAIRADAEKQAKRMRGEGYTYEQGRIAAIDAALELVAPPGDVPQRDVA